MKIPKFLYLIVIVFILLIFWIFLCYNNTTNLIYVIDNNDVIKIKKILRWGVYINYRDQRAGYTPLIAACEVGNIEVVKLIIKYGANINKTDYGGNTPLIHALVNKKENIIKFLVEYGADVNIKGGFTALELAKENNQKKIIELIIKNSLEISDTKK